MAIKTGRARTLTVGGSITGNFIVADIAPFMGGSGVPGTYTNIRATASCNGIDVEFHLLDAFADVGGFYWGINSSVAITTLCFPGIPAGGSNDHLVWGPFAPYFGYTTLNLSGTFTFSIPVEEWVEFSSPGTFPTFGGASSDDYPFEQKLTFYEQTVIGSTVSASFTINGVTSSASGTVTTAVTVDYVVGGSLIVEQASFSNQQCDIEMQCDFLDAGVGIGYSRSNGDVSVGVSGLTATAAISGGGTPGQSGQILFNGGMPKSYSLDGVIRAWADPYPDHLTLKIDRASNDLARGVPAGATFSDSNTQHQYSAFSILNGVDEGDITKSPVNVDEYQDLRLWVDPPSLAALNEDVTDWRIMMRGLYFDTGLSYAQSAAFNVDAGNLLTVIADPYPGVWTADRGTVAVAGGGIAIGASADNGTAHRSFTKTGGAGFSGYRYLAVKCKASSDGVPFGVMIGPKSWNQDYQGNALKANNSSATLYIDLCSPTNSVASTDPTDSRWILPTVDGPLWGVTSVAQMDFIGVPNGKTLTLQSIDLSRHPSAGYSTMTVMPSRTPDAYKLEQLPTMVGDVTSSTYVRRFLMGDTDSRLSLETTDVRKTITSSPSAGDTTSYAEVSLGILAGNGPGNPALEPFPVSAGWTAAGSTSATDGTTLSTYLNANRPGYWAYGDGALWAKLGLDTASQWHYGIDIDCTSGAGALPAQAVFDVLSWYPGCGDVLKVLDGAGTGAYGGAVTVKAAKFLRGQSWGTVIDKDNKPVVGATVVVQLSSDHSPAGSGATAAQGDYKTGLAYGKGKLTYDTIAQSGDTPYSVITRPFIGRRRLRGAFRTVKKASSRSPYNIETRRGHYHRVCGRTEGGILYARSIYRETPFDGYGLVSNSAKDSEARMWELPLGRLILLFTRMADDMSVSIVEAYSDDHGYSWSEEQMPVFTGGKHPHITGSVHTATMLRAAYVSDPPSSPGGPTPTVGTIHGRLQAAGDTQPGDEFQFCGQDGTTPLKVIDDSFSFAPGWSHQDVWLGVWTIDGDSGVSEWMSFDNGRTWIPAPAP